MLRVRCHAGRYHSPSRPSLGPRTSRSRPRRYGESHRYGGRGDSGKTAAAQTARHRSPPGQRCDARGDPHPAGGPRTEQARPREAVKEFNERFSIDREPFGLCDAGPMRLSQEHPIHVRTGYQARPAPRGTMNLLRLNPSDHVTCDESDETVATSGFGSV